MLGVGAARHMAIYRFVTMIWYWELKSLADIIPIGKPTDKMTGYFSEDDRVYSETAWSGETAKKYSKGRPGSSSLVWLRAGAIFP